MWLNQVSCDENSPHILRCQHSVVHGQDRDSSGICGPNNEKLLVNCGKYIDFGLFQDLRCKSDRFVEALG